MKNRKSEVHNAEDTFLVKWKNDHCNKMFFSVGAFKLALVRQTPVTVTHCLQKLLQQCRATHQ